MHNYLVKSTGKRCNVHKNAKPRQGRMDIVHIRKKDEEDRLSSLPDDIIHKILAFVSLRDAIEVSVLSSRWRSIWTTMPFLNIEDFDTSSPFSKLFSNVMSRRNNKIQLSSVKLAPQGPISHESFERILNHAFSYNLQQLTVECDLESRVEFPFSHFTSHSLKHLTLRETRAILTPTWDLPAITTLDLHYVTLSYEHTDMSIGLFSKCTNLRNLSISGFEMTGTDDVINVCHPGLINLTLENPSLAFEAVYVVAPQLKSLALKGFHGKQPLRVNAPNLTSLVMNGDHPLQFSAQDFPSLENVDLGPFSMSFGVASSILCLLQHLHKVKFLTLDWEFLELLSSPKGLIYLPQPSGFSNLKILKFTTGYQARVYMEVPACEKATTSTEIENYDSSESAIFTMVSCEEMRVMRNIISAQRLIADLRLLQSISKRAHMKRVETCEVEFKKQSEFETPSRFRDMIAQIKQGKIDGLVTECTFVEMMAQIKQWHVEGLLPTTKMYDLTIDVISSLQHIKELVMELPASKRAVMQPLFSSLCEDAAIRLNDMFKLFKDPNDEGTRLLDNKVY